MHADHFYTIGTAHAVCEDYTISGTEEGLSYALLSDGCSSSKDTDVGARILCHIAKNALLYLHRQGNLRDEHYVEEMLPPMLKNLIVMKALEAKVSMGLDYNAFDATLLISFAVERPNDKPIWGSIMYGDGTAVRRYGKDSFELCHVSYDSNAPYYLSYAMSKDKSEGYFWSFGQSKRRNTLVGINGNDPMNIKEYASDPMTDCAYHMSYNLCMLCGEDPLQIALFSDGVDSYEHDGPEGKTPRSYLDVVTDAIGYKNTAGEFVYRRMRAMEKELKSRGYEHFDDLSCAAIHIGPVKGRSGA